jgi:hypothetical protein
MKGNLTRRGKSSWRLKFDSGRDPDTGRRITKFVTLRGTKAQAQAEATKILAEVAAGTHVGPSKVTVGEFVRARVSMGSRRHHFGQIRAALPSTRRASNHAAHRRA